MTDIATRETARVDLSGGALEDLRAEVRGAVLEPADPGQQEVRAVFNAIHPSDPALTVRCSGTADVITAVNFARNHGLTLAVRGGVYLNFTGLADEASSAGVDICSMPSTNCHLPSGPSSRCATSWERPRQRSASCWGSPRSTSVCCCTARVPGCVPRSCH